MSFDERDLYTGLAAVHWATISITDPRRDQAFYRRVIRRNGGKALELGCGAGRLLLAFLEEGLDVQGVDISGDMLAVCREDGKRKGLQPVLYEQKMQCLDVPYSFATIYIPCGSFECVMDRDEALETLRRCYAHLDTQGQLAFTIGPAHHMYNATDSRKTYPGEWTLRSKKDLPEGRQLYVYLREMGEDPVEQIQMQERRYEVYENGNLIQEEVHAGQTRWYHRNELLWMLKLSGFSGVEVKGEFTDEELNAGHQGDMVFIATKSATT
jgi:ubiquinone/menaquinone biosynthesis C-methylase UbiE